MACTSLNRPLRIAILAPIAWRTPPVHYGGWELVAGNLTEGLARRGHDVTLFATANSITAAKLVSVCPRPLEEDRTLDARAHEAIHAANAFEHAGEFDIIHNNAGCYPVCYSRVVGTPLVVTLHGSAEEEGSRLIYRRYRDLPYVSITDSERQNAPDLNYVATVYNGIAVDSFPYQERKEDYLVFLGRVSLDKGTHMAVEVARRTGRRLIIAGIVPDDEREYYDQKVAPYIDGDQILFIGPVNHEQKAKLCRSAVALLHLVTYPEAFGLTMVEAMACGTPVIATRMGSVPEVVDDGVTGFVVDTVDEACHRVSDLVHISPAQCRRRAESRFSVDQMVEGYLRVYRRVLGLE